MAYGGTPYGSGVYGGNLPASSPTTNVSPLAAVGTGAGVAPTFSARPAAAVGAGVGVKPTVTVTVHPAAAAGTGIGHTPRTGPADAVIYTCIPSNPSNGYVDAFDLTTNTSVPGSPFLLPSGYPAGATISPDSNWLAITCQELAAQGVVMVDISDPLNPIIPGAVIPGSSGVPYAGPIGSIFDSTSTHLWVNNEYGDGSAHSTVGHFQLIGGVWTLVGSPIFLSQPWNVTSDYAQELTLTADDRWLIDQFFSNGTGTAVDFIDTTLTTPAVVYTVTTNVGPSSTCILGTNLLVACGGTNLLDVIDLTPLPGSTPTLGGTTIPVGNGPWYIIANNLKTKAMVTCIVDSTAYIIDASNIFATPTLVSDPSGFINAPIQGGWSPDGSLFFVSNTGDNYVVTIDVATATVISRRASLVGIGNLAMAVTPGTIVIPILPAAAPGTGVGVNPTPKITVFPPTAVGAGVGVKPTAASTVDISPLAAAGAGVGAYGIPTIDAVPGAAPASGVGVGPAIKVAAVPGAAPGAGVGVTPSPTVAIQPTAAPGVGAGTGPTSTVGAVPSSASGAGAGNASAQTVDVFPPASAGVGVGVNPAVSTVPVVTVFPLAAVGTGVSVTATVTVKVAPGSAPGTGVGVNPSVSTTGNTNVSPLAAVGSGAGVGPNITVAIAPPAGSGTGVGVSQTTGVNVTAQASAAVGVGVKPSVATGSSVNVSPLAAVGVGVGVSPKFAITAVQVFLTQARTMVFYTQPRTMTVDTQPRVMTFASQEDT